jgi:hypothetical protein
VHAARPIAISSLLIWLQTVASFAGEALRARYEFTGDRMDDDEARQLALKIGATRVIEFAQVQHHCIAYTATWIRRRFKDRELFDAKKGMGEYNVGADKPVRWVTNMARNALGEKIPHKFAVKQNAFEDNDARLAAEHEKNLRRPIDERTPPLMSMESRYIIGGRSYAGLSQGPWSDRVMRLLPEIPKVHIDGAQTFIDVFFGIFQARCFGSIAFRTHRAHAVALDCSRQGECVYFDPNIGEFTFPTFDMFSNWWRQCFDDRDRDDGAWHDINVQGHVRADRYARPL